MVTQGGDPYSAMQWVAGHHAFGVTWIPNQAYRIPAALVPVIRPAWVAVPPSSLHRLGGTLHHDDPGCTGIIAENTGRPRTFLHSAVRRDHILPPHHPDIVYRPDQRLLLLLLAITAILWEKGKWEWGGLLLPLLMLKPNLGAPMVVLLGLWLLFQKRYKAILAMVFMGMILLVVGFLQNPHWLSAYWSIGNTKLAETFGGSPTVWGLGALISHNQITATLIIGSLAGLLILFGFFRAILHSRATLRPVSVLALAVCVTLLVTPYTWTYDQLLLILPLTAVILAMDRMGVRFPLTASLFLGIDVLAVILLVLR